MNFSGFVNAGLQLGVSSIMVSPKRGIYSPTLSDGTLLSDIIAQATVEEHHTDTLEVTEHPVQQGAPISDHAFKRPAEVTLTLGWSNSPSDDGGLLNSALGFATANSTAVRNVANVAGVVAGIAGIQSTLSGAGQDQIEAIYQSLLLLQSQRALFTLYTGKRVYDNMICVSLKTETDFKSANSLPITMVCKEILIVNSQVVGLPATVQAQPNLTASPIENGTKSLITK